MPGPGANLGFAKNPRWMVVGVAVAVTAFHLAHETGASVGMVAVPFGLLPLSFLGTARRTFYATMGAGLACVGPQLGFFWGIFGPAAFFLWFTVAFWMALALTLMRSVRLRWGTRAALLLAPWIWCGCEYFRSELYFLRFSWLSAGFVHRHAGGPGALPLLGVYGIGFVTWACAAWFWLGPRRGRALAPIAALAFALAPLIPASDRSSGPRKELRIAGAQVETTLPVELPLVLDRVLARHPEAELLVLPEYSLGGEPDEDLRDWCRRHRRHLVVGGKAAGEHGGFYNTAFVLGPEGTTVFRQAKSVPIQFFDDGHPAPTQALWASPWGPVGIAICYDLSYRRVMDRLVRLGATVLIVPTMDAIGWGTRQHALHARVAPTRAAEYGLPIVRVASSGVSQLVDARGRVTASAPFSERVEILGGTVALAGRGRVPIDHVLGPVSTGMTGLVMLLLAWRHKGRPRSEDSPTSPVPVGC